MSVQTKGVVDSNKGLRCVTRQPTTCLTVEILLQRSTFVVETRADGVITVRRLGMSSLRNQKALHLAGLFFVSPLTNQT